MNFVMDFCPTLSQVGPRFTIVRVVWHIVVAPAFGVFCPNAPDALFLSLDSSLEPFPSALCSKDADGWGSLLPACGESSVFVEME
jgi:hypothetical protein